MDSSFRPDKAPEMAAKNAVACGAAEYAPYTVELERKQQYAETGHALEAERMQYQL